MKIVNTMLVFGIVSILAVTSAKAQEGGCDGPKDHNSATGGYCQCSGNNPINATCGGPVITINYWTSCGGTNAAECFDSQEQVGTYATCVKTVDWEGYQKAWQPYLKCQYENAILKAQGLPTIDCGPPPPSVCNYISCNASTNPTPIYAQVYLWSDGTCFNL
jgi:hypothetical protein